MKIGTLPGQLFLVFALGYPVLAQQTGQDSTGLPGDNFSLQGALELFETATSPEEFEKALNTEENHVNNLDLNEDGEIDYIRVVDMTEDLVHVFVIQVPVSDKESQDIAVIELERTGDESAVLQIVGDEDIYGEEVIFEPEGTDEKAGRKGAGPSENLYGPDSYVVVNVWLWPSVRFVYASAYKPWVSPWRWRHYPGWWHTWRPVKWHVWHPHHRHFHRSYVVVHSRRVAHAPRIYRPVRRTSVTVHKRHAATVNNYRVHRSKVTVTGPKGNTATVKRTTAKGPKGKVRGRKTTVTGPKGNVRGSKTTARGPKGNKRSKTAVKRKKN